MYNMKYVYFVYVQSPHFHVLAFSNIFKLISISYTIKMVFQ